MKTTAVVFGAMAVFSLVTLTAQTRPSFAGKWTLVADPAATPAAPAPPAAGGRGRGGGGLGREATIIQNAATLTIVRVGQSGETRTVYKLDGSVNNDKIVVSGMSINTVAKTTWAGEKLVITTSGRVLFNSFETKLTLALGPGGSLIVESTRPDVQGSGPPIVTKTTYKKN